jgi:hypothetical protein
MFDISKKEKIETYFMPSSARGRFILEGVLTLMFSLIGFISAITSAIGLSSSHIPQVFMASIFIVSGFIFLRHGLYYINKGLRVGQIKIEVSTDGIARLEKDEHHVFIRWEEVAHVKNRFLAQQIGVYSREPGRKIMVDYQFEGFERIKDRVFKEFANHLTLPPFPAAYGKLPALPSFGLMVFFVFIVGLLFWMEYSPMVGGIHKEALGYGAIILGVVYFLKFLG